MSASESNVAVLYHADCADGFACAVAAYKSLGPGPAYLPCHYGRPLPDFGAAREVYLLDFCPEDAKELAKLAKRVDTLVIIDHHATHKAMLADFARSTSEIAAQPIDNVPQVVVKFEDKHAACWASWRYFHPGGPVPPLLRYISDRDLWTFALPESRAVNAGLRSYPLDFETWLGLIAAGDETIQRLKIEGSAVRRAVERSVERQTRTPRLCSFFGYDEIPCVNASEYASEVCHALLEQYPDAPFAVAFRIDNERRAIFNLRGCGAVDVSKLAEQMGGGGHKNAAGFRTVLAALLPSIGPDEASAGPDKVVEPAEREQAATAELVEPEPEPVVEPEATNHQGTKDTKKGKRAKKRN